MNWHDGESNPKILQHSTAFFQRFDHGVALKLERKLSHINIAFDRYASIGTIMHYILVISIPMILLQQCWSTATKKLFFFNLCIACVQFDIVWYFFSLYISRVPIFAFAGYQTIVSFCEKHLPQVLVLRFLDECKTVVWLQEIIEKTC